jgi:hypothetical protein
MTFKFCSGGGTNATSSLITQTEKTFYKNNVTRIGKIFQRKGSTGRADKLVGQRDQQQRAQAQPHRHQDETENFK